MIPIDLSVFHAIFNQSKSLINKSLSSISLTERKHKGRPCMSCVLHSLQPNFPRHATGNQRHSQTTTHTTATQQINNTNNATKTTRATIATKETARKPHARLETPTTTSLSTLTNGSVRSPLLFDSRLRGLPSKPQRLYTRYYTLSSCIILLH